MLMHVWQEPDSAWDGDAGYDIDQESEPSPPPSPQLRAAGPSAPKKRKPAPLAPAEPEFAFTWWPEAVKRLFEQGELSHFSPLACE